MPHNIYSVTLDVHKCKGCTNCIKRCPMEAIRVHNGKAIILKERCIDCGECIQCCPNHAILPVTEELEKRTDYTYTIALPDPSFFGQFKEEGDLENILNAFLRIGFDEVFEVSLAAEIVGFIIRQYLMSQTYTKPLFSSSCPAVLRLMQIKFPDLLGQVVPILSPMEVAGRLAKEEAAKRTGLPYTSIGTFFISPCPAKVTSITHPLNVSESAINGAIATNTVYKHLIKHISKNSDRDHIKKLHKSTKRGMAWGYVTGESKSIEFGTTLAVSGIHNVISLLEEIERGELQDVDFIELQACTGGCVGGPLNIQNVFVGRVKLREFIKKYETQEPFYTEEELLTFYQSKRFSSTELIHPRTIMTLDDDVSKALIKMEQLDTIARQLPGLDCGACGSPNCRAFAEDIVRGIAVETDCVIKLRGKVKNLAEEILDLARVIPPAMDNSSKKKKE